MTRKILLGCLLGILLIGGLQLSLAVNVVGPFNNSHTEVSFTRYCHWIYLHAINSADQPHRILTDWHDLVSYYNNEQYVYDAWTGVIQHPLTWVVEPFAEPNGPDPVIPWRQIPSLLCENNKILTGFPLGLVKLTAATHQPTPGFDPQLVLGAGGVAGGWEPSPCPPPEEPFSYSFTRLIAPRDNEHIDRQWMAAYDHTNNQGLLVTTNDGWMTDHWLLDARQYFENLGIYSIGIDDRVPLNNLPDDNPTKIIFVTTTSDPNFHNSLDPHINHILCNGVAYTLDGGDTWQFSFVPGWPAALYNAHVVVISEDPQDTQGSLRVYLVGMNMSDPNRPTVFCRWTRVVNGVVQPWITAAGWGTSVQIPYYPFDMVGHWNPAGDTIKLMVATQRGMYYNAQGTNQMNLPAWQARNNGLMTWDFRDICEYRDPRIPGWAGFNVLGIAGEECSYFTNDMGVNWYQIHNAGPIVQYPFTGARQCQDSMIVVYPRPAFTSLPATQTHYVPIAAQNVRHQEGGPEPLSRFRATYHVGYTYDDFAKLISYDIEPTATPHYYVAYADPFLGVNPNPLYTKGVAFTSRDRGRSWNAGQFIGREWRADVDRVPVPSQILADPANPLIAYLSFYNANGVAQSGDIPPFCITRDGGASWTTPHDEGLPLGGSPRHLAAGVYVNSRILYMTVGSELYRSIADWGEHWERVALPAEFHGNEIISLSCGDDNGKNVVVATRDYFAVGRSAGDDWITVSPMHADFIEQVILEPYGMDPNILWAVTGTWQPADRILWKSEDSGQTWTDVMNWDFFGDGIVPLRSEIYAERERNAHNRRIIWTACEGSSGAERAVTDPVVVKYYEDGARVAPGTAASLTVPNGNLPTTFALSDCYPNPFNMQTRLRFELPEFSHVELNIYNTQGQKVATLVDADRPAGRYNITWDGRNASGGVMASGLYLCQIKAGAFTSTRKMLLVK